MARGLLGQSGLVLAAKVMAAGAAYVLAWALGRVAGVEAFGRFELVLTLFGMAAMLGRSRVMGLSSLGVPTERTKRRRVSVSRERSIFAASQNQFGAKLKSV